MAKLFNKQNFIGALLFLILVGEPTVGIATGLYTPRGFIVLFLLYFTFFILLRSLADRYKLNNVSLVLITFAFYSVLITGLLHGELMDYVLRPENTFITTVIRIQCSFYTLFAFYMLRQLPIKPQPALSPSFSLILFVGYIALLTPTGIFGFGKLIQTFQTVPLISAIFSGLAVIALVLAFKQPAALSAYYSRSFNLWAIILLALGAIPCMATFIFLLAVMIIVTVIFLLKPIFRSGSVVLFRR